MQKKQSQSTVGAQTKPNSRIVGNGSNAGNKPAPKTSHRIMSDDRNASEEQRRTEEDDPLLDKRDLAENRLTGDQDDIEWDPDSSEDRHSGL